MANQEEDATDLHFPKDNIETFQMDCEDASSDFIISDERSCSNCTKKLTAPYIECDECSRIIETTVYICLNCFSEGTEFEYHQNFHDYVIVRDNFELIDKDWTAAEEIKYLDSLVTCGFGNWDAISKKVDKKSASECENHYNNIYATDDNYIEKPKAHPRKHILGISDPPRPIPQTVACQELAGYNAARSDFEVEHDNSAEMLLMDVGTFNLATDSDEGNEMTDDEKELNRELIRSVGDCYLSRVNERDRRKKIIKTHGLISQDKAFIHYNRARRHLPFNLSKLFPKLHQLLDFNKLSWLIESFKVESDLHERLRILNLYRHSGLTNLTSATVFEELNEKRTNQLREKKAMIMGGSSSKNTIQFSSVLGTRRISIPLDVIGRAGYEKLNEAERKLCAEIRLLPLDFLRFKTMLITECKQQKGLRLASARPLLSIDVNKTRKIYDLLLSKNEISIPK